MAKIARHGDLYAGPFSFNPPGIVATATKTFINGKAVARVGDPQTHLHWWPFLYWITGVINSGSSSVKAEGKKVARLGDTLSCGCTIVSASPDVDAG